MGVWVSAWGYKVAMDPLGYTNRRRQKEEELGKKNGKRKRVTRIEERDKHRYRSTTKKPGAPFSALFLLLSVGTI